MSLFGSATRDELRQTYSDAWQKRLDGTPLTPLEALLTSVIGLHPEYQAMLSDAQASLAFESNAVPAGDNPFLHMGLHVAVREQLAIDRPPGVRELERRLRAQYGDSHRAEHVLMEALAETLWEAQRSGTSPDETKYLSLARGCLKGG